MPGVTVVSIQAVKRQDTQRFLTSSLINSKQNVYCGLESRDRRLIDRDIILDLLNLIEEVIRIAGGDNNQLLCILG